MVEIERVVRTKILQNGDEIPVPNGVVYLVIDTARNLKITCSTLEAANAEYNRLIYENSQHALQQSPLN